MENIRSPWKKVQNLIIIGLLIRPQALETPQKIIKVRRPSIPDYRATIFKNVGWHRCFIQSYVIDLVLYKLQHINKRGQKKQEKKYLVVNKKADVCWLGNELPMGPSLITSTHFWNFYFFRPTHLSYVSIDSTERQPKLSFF